MADINVERKAGMGWLWWVLGLIVLALLLWWVLAPDGEEVAMVEPVAEQPIVAPEPMPEMAPQADVTIAQILANPTMYVGTEYSGEVTVAEVPTDRGFWIENEGQRLFAVIIDQPLEEPKDINPDQTLQITQGTIQDQTHLPQLEGAALDDRTRQIIQEEPVFLVVDEANIEILTAGTPQPGTTPAQSVQ